MGGSHALARTLAVAAALAAGSAAWAGDLSGRVDATWADERADLSRNQYFRQLYELEARQPVSDAIQYSARLRLTEDQGESTLGPTTTPMHRRDAFGQANLGWSREAYGLLLRHELGWSADVRGLRADGAERLLQRSLVSGRWRVTAPLDLTAGWEHLTLSGAAPTRTSSDDRFSAGAVLSPAPGVRASEENRFERSDDGVNTRTSYGPRVAIDWSRDWGAGTSAAARYSGDWSWIQERTVTGQDSRFAVELTPAAGLWAWDDTPNDTTTTPLVATPALVDRNFAASAGIAIGPAGLSSQNVGVDLGRFVAVDELRVSVRASTATPVPFPGPVTWSAWWSNDGVTWARATGESTTWDGPLSAYVVAFQPATARFFKVVNFGTNTVDTVVTELQPFVHETLEHSQRREMTTLVQSLGANVTFRPLEKLQVSYAGNLNALGSSVGDAATIWSTDSSHTLSARAGPFDDVTFQADLSRWDARVGDLPAEHNLAGATTATWRPQPRAEAAVTLRGGELSQGGESATTWGAGARGQLGWFEALRLTASLDWGHDRFADGTTDFVNGQAAAGFRAGPGLDLNGTIGVQRITGESGTSPGTSLPLLMVYQYERYQLQALYRAGEPLQIDLRVGYFRSDAAAGVIQSGRLTWTPFRGTAVQLVAEYDDDVDPLSGRTFQRFQLYPRWMLNRHAALQLNYNWTRSSGDGSSRRDVLYLTFTMRT
jgi:hypothetical protein